MSERDWSFYVDDMIRFAANVLDYVDGLNQQTFEATGLNFDATVRNLELIGEAASHIPQDVRDRHPDIPWRMLVATRNRLIHGYLGIDSDTLWSIIQDDVSSLLSQLKMLRQSLKQ